jgi:hypothetical protein
MERVLTQEQLDELGLFRQGYQQLRESIRDVRPLTWGSSNHPEYLAFKRGCRTVIDIISNLKRGRADPKQFQFITANLHESRWKALNRDIP